MRIKKLKKKYYLMRIKTNKKVTAKALKRVMKKQRKKKEKE
jgi:hypothetical protein